MSIVPAFELDDQMQEWWRNRFQQEGSLFKIILDASKWKKFYEFGNSKQIIIPHYYEYKDHVKNMEIKKDDVWLFGFPRSGTTLTTEMLWLLDHNLDFETAKKYKLASRCVNIDAIYICPKESSAVQKFRAELAEEYFDYLNEDLTLNRPSPRHFKTHLLFELLPDNLVEKAKVFYVAREVKDVIVSKYHLDQLRSNLKKGGDFKSYCLDFIEGRVIWGPYFAHLKSGWSKRNHPNVMFMFYEDIIMDLPGTIRRVSEFLGKSYSEEQLEELHKHLRFDNMKKNEAVIESAYDKPEFKNKNAQPFIRQGKSGTWRDYFDDELLEKTEAWIERNLAGTDIKYPTSKTY